MYTRLVHTPFLSGDYSKIKSDQCKTTVVDINAINNMQSY